MKKPAERSSVDAQLGEVAALRHRDPHSVLGIHVDGEGVVIRTLRPDAERIVVIPESGGRLDMVHRGAGIFETRLNNKTEVFPYLLEVHYRGGQVFTVRDPYCFMPTLGDLDVYLTNQGKHQKLWEKLGAHPTHHGGVSGVKFAVWAPMAAGVSVVGDFNSWDGRLHQMRAMGSSGIWELFIPEVAEGTRYKYEVRTREGARLLKADPFAFRTEAPPLTASVVHDLTHFRWSDEAWVASRSEGVPHEKPWSIYEVHLGSWMRVIEEDNRPFTYRELAPRLAEYCKELGFTHVELLPVSEYPFGGSWGYQVGGYYAPTARFGHPDDFRYLVNHLHEQGLGVIIDWVPAHFPRDAHALARFDGTAVYEHADPRQGAHPDWGTLVFNYGRHEVRNFLVANALFWLDQYHVDGLRVDAVASMLYLDYSRKAGEWIPNKHGGRENLEAIEFLRELNALVDEKFKGAVVIAEESTAWPRVTGPTREGGLGFHFKWNMGWMHDNLKYFSTDPLYRRWHHNQLTFGMLYAYSEHYMLPLSHDEVVHGKGSLFGKMPGDRWQKFANLRSLFGWMWAFPGKKLLFMGGEFGQSAEWNHDRSLDWHLLKEPDHKGVQQLISDLNALYAGNPALHQGDGDPVGFQWIQADSAEVNVYAFLRRSRDQKRELVVVANFSPTPRHGYRIGVPAAGEYAEVLNSDAGAYGGSGVGNYGKVTAEEKPWNGQPASLELTLPPLAVVFLEAAAK